MAQGQIRRFKIRSRVQISQLEHTHVNILESQLKLPSEACLYSIYTVLSHRAAEAKGLNKYYMHTGKSDLKRSEESVCWNNCRLESGHVPLITINSHMLLSC